MPPEIPTLEIGKSLKATLASSITDWRGPISCEGTVHLCRCGQSKAMPICDHTHREIQFPDESETARVASTPPNSAPADPSLRITVIRDGPYRVLGNPHIIGAQQRNGMFSLCRCGASENKPWCDGSHGRISFRDQE